MKKPFYQKSHNPKVKNPRSISQTPQVTVKKEEIEGCCTLHYNGYFIGEVLELIDGDYGYYPELPEEHPYLDWHMLSDIKDILTTLNKRNNPKVLGKDADTVSN